ncbi:MAG: HEAT repeat domain-containing protein [Asgard group archaeon]|nr:HEAT repeat domain-containing protein [Asgard group archaeon]
MAFIKRFIQRGIAKRRLSSEEEIDRVKAVLTFADVGTERSLEQLIEGLEDPSWNVRNACAMAIAQIYEKEPNNELITTLHNELENASLAKKLAIIETLGKIGNDNSLPILKEYLQKSRADLQYAIIIALSNWANLDLLPSLISVGDSKDYLTRRAALMSSYEIIADALPNSTLQDFLPYFKWIVQIYVETGYLGPLILRFFDLDKTDLDTSIFPVPLNEYEFVLINELLDESDFNPKRYELFHEMAYPIMF